MYVTHVIASLDISNGGTSKCVGDIALAQAKSGAKVCVFTSISQQSYLSGFEHENLRLVCVKHKDFRKKLKEYIGGNNTDVLHGHGLWQLPVHYMARSARMLNIPYVMTPHGMLEPWALEQSRLKKKIALRLYQRRDLQSANMLHATAQMEAEQFLRLGFSNPVAVIPNGIDLSEFPLKETCGRQSVDGKKQLLFLSRIHPKKGIEVLIDAWAAIRPDLKARWCVKIAGNGDEGYVTKLNRKISSLGLDDQIEIVGPKFGEEKREMYWDADLFVLPTYSENFGVVVAEALAYGVPVITTKGAPWGDLQAFNCGWWIDLGVEPLRECLERALVTPTDVTQRMGRNGRNLIIEKYSIEKVSRELLDICSNIK